MSESLEKIARRIKICSAEDVPTRFSKSIGAIITVADKSVAEKNQFDYSQTIHHISTFYNQPAYVPAEESPELKRRCLQKDLDVAKQTLVDIGDKTLLLHCTVGVEKSPTFVLFLLSYLQGENPNIDKSMALLHQIKSDTLLSVNLETFRPYFGDQLQDYIDAIKNYNRAKTITRCKTIDELKSKLPSLFESSTQPTRENLQQFCGRFGMSLPTLTN